MKNNKIFEKGIQLPEQFKTYFTGDTYLNMLLQHGNENNIAIAYVTFEPASINNWHAHAGGQVLVCIEGEGWYQEWNKPAQKLLPGDVVAIPKDVKHWHGASKTSLFGHLSIETNTNEGRPTWFEAVNQEDYQAL
jgi:quercetin dioxygenase-like cupin family protein